MIDDRFWPSPEALLDLSEAKQLTDGKARCVSFAICDAEGRPVEGFYLGQDAHFFYEFEILAEIGAPSGGLAFRDYTNRVIHGKNTFQFDTPVPSSVQPGTRLRYHHVVRMDITPGQYVITLGMASTQAEALDRYRSGSMTQQEFDRTVKSHCRAINAGTFSVGLDPMERLLHHGLANLPGEYRVMVVEPEPVPALGAEVASTDSIVMATTTNGSPQSRQPSFEFKPAARKPALPFALRSNAQSPTIMHVTHWKAGSQWMRKILHASVPKLVVATEVGNTQFLKQPVLPGRVYPALYVTKQEFDSVELPPDWRRFVVVRDLRDTLISGYFSIKVSHPILSDSLADWRSNLHTMGIEDGLVYLMDKWLLGSARIQTSWLEAGERLIHYEDLLEWDLEILEQVLLEECQLPIPRQRLRNVVQSMRFERLTKGRQRGEENVEAHERKGIAGDWRNYFTGPVKQAFKHRFGGLLVATGYEADLNW
jgi:lipopolysaccharide transport system ATP-binding protein